MQSGRLGTTTAGKKIIDREEHPRPDAPCPSKLELRVASGPVQPGPGFGLQVSGPYIGQLMRSSRPAVDVAGLKEGGTGWGVGGRNSAFICRLSKFFSQLQVKKSPKQSQSSRHVLLGGYDLVI